MFVSIITVNYNGKKLLKKFLESVSNIDYPKDKYEVIMVDNGSTDGSVRYVKNNYQSVRIVESKKNLGFGGGNNLGIKISKGDLVYLINNDTKITKDAVKNSVLSFKKWSKKQKVGAVTSKLLLYDSYLSLKLYGATLADYKLNTAIPVNRKPLTRDFPMEKRGFQMVLLPFSHESNREIKFELSFAKTNKKKFKILLDGVIVGEYGFDKNKNHKKVSLVLTKNQISKHRHDLFQNAGNYYFRDGYGRDRGVYVVQNQQYYEIDEGQYESEEIVPGFNGAAVLLNKNALKQVGLFDESYFMYYEDGDLSIRLKKNNWEIIYCPKSVIRHTHSASSKEFSDFFIYHTERNRLLFVIKHWPVSIVIGQYISYFFRDLLIIPIYYIVKGEAHLGFKRMRTRVRVFLSLIPHMAKCIIPSNRFTRDEVMKLL